MSSSINDDEFFEDEKETIKTELDKLYEYGTLCVRRKAGEINKDHLLYFYARFKFITEGPCNTERPSGLFNFEAKTKWDSWKELGKNNMTKEKCQQEYIDKLDQVLPNWRDGYENNENLNDNAEKKGTFGIRMSTMSQIDEPINPDEMNCFDMCKEDRLDKLIDYLKYNKNDLNKIDENGMTMLMWACDRGNLDIVKLLVENKADLNIQDNEGQSCLHYAVSCEHIDILKYLLNQSDINKTLTDSDGQSATSLTNNKEIINLFLTN